MARPPEDTNGSAGNRRAARYAPTFQILCVASAVGVLAISPLVKLFGRPASFVVAAVLATTALHTALYVFRKNRADNAYLDAATSPEEAA